MPSIDMPAVYEYLPQLKNLHIQNCDEFKKENFISMQRRLVTYKGLETLGLELLSFDLDDVKKEFLDILRIHSDSLRRLSLARNKVSNVFLKDICQVIQSSLPSLEFVDLRHLKDTNKIDWTDLLASLSILSSRERSKPIKVLLSDYQTQSKRKDIFNYLQT